MQDTCPVCVNEIETIYHALVCCHFAAQCWSIANVHIHNMEEVDFSSWLDSRGDHGPVRLGFSGETGTATIYFRFLKSKTATAGSGSG